MSETGLTSEQAGTRLEAEGPNALPESDRRSGLRIIGEVLCEPILVLLILSGLIYMVPDALLHGLKHLMRVVPRMPAAAWPPH